jgi:hypothetical protein
MTPSKLGHRAAAQAGDVACPFSPGSHDADAWHEAHQRANTFRARGLDPNGHDPPPPHLCPRNTKFVCNCCHACTTECRTEEPAKSMTIDRVMWAVIRIAHALETSGDRTAWPACKTCGSVSRPEMRIGDPRVQCLVCGAAPDAG